MTRMSTGDARLGPAVEELTCEMKISDVTKVVKAEGISSSRDPETI